MGRMIVSVQKSILVGEVSAPASKSYTHRAVFAAALGDGKCCLSNCLISEDTRSTMKACRLFGGSFEEISDKIYVSGFGKRLKVPDEIVDVGNSGTTLRFMTALSALCGSEITLLGDASLQKRPNTPLLETLQKMGARAYSKNNNGCAPLVVEGKIKPGIYSIDGSVSSQFISALLLVCPLLDGPTELSIHGELKSKPYVDITMDVAKAAGIEILEQIEQTDPTDPTDPTDQNKNSVSAKTGGKISYKIKGNQAYHLENYTVPGDFSSVSYVLAAAAMISGSDVDVKNLFPSAQGDLAIIHILKEMGADISWDKKEGTVHVSNSGKTLTGICVDAGEIPDLVPTLAVLGTFSEGRMEIKNAGHVRFKETDRLHAMATELSKMGAEIIETADGLIISGKGGAGLFGANLCGWDDHRIVMALFVAGLMTGGTTIDTAESVRISYPRFFEDMKKIGANAIEK
ncbi:3-phosphoshikimate 1-carboxyvinyltransferase [Methanolapillus ohkumae]|uniref:3-phosphoshikimate 1-carboxyvinyltransferase n=1 Tax=Methanolapillus ohkumae TaxID=3028298 RepID=A0AA96VFW0_9EURY|nr:3-phosphoshikimate 1-carboxyvinyltransferase [Methanosarcinaceae archaeon Am2]